MSDPYLGEIRMFAGNFAPRNNAYCSGQLLNIAQNSASFVYCACSRFTATVRPGPSFVRSRARWTVAIPPAASSSKSA